MAPKWLGRPRRSCAGRVRSLAFALCVFGAPHLARADGSALPIVDTKAPRATVGVPASAALSVSGGTPPYKFEVVAGALPVGLSLARDGKVSGTPTQGGPFRFTVRVTDSASLPASVLQSYAMVVQGRPDPSLDPNAVALRTQQAGAVRRFALAQIGNVEARLQALRSDSAGWCPQGNRAAPPAKADAGDTKAKAGMQAGPPQAAQSFSLPIDDCRTLADRNTTLWTAGSLDIGSMRAQSGAEAIRFDSQGLTLGGDLALRPNLALGASVGLARDASLAIPSAGAATDASGTSVAGYLSYRPLDLLYLQAVVGVGGVAMDGSRVVAGGDLYATRRAEQRFIALSAGSRLSGYGWQVAPYTRIDHVRATLRQFTESGAGPDALTFTEEKVPSLRLVAGATVATSFSTMLGILAPRTSFEYRRELDRWDAASLRYADDPGGPAYGLLPGAVERDSTTLGLGANLMLTSRWNFGLGGTVNRSTLTNSNRIDATVSRVF